MAADINMLIISKLDVTYVQDIAAFLNAHSKVGTKICSDLQGAVAEIKINRPDIIFVSIMGNISEFSQLLKMIDTKFSSIPTIIYGTQSDCVNFNMYLDKPQFFYMKRPSGNEEIYIKIMGIMRNKHIKVLLVDDDPVQLRTMRQALSMRYTVSVALSGFEAINEIKKNTPDIVFLDYEMPNFTGKDCLAEIRDIRGGWNIKVVFLTGVQDKRRIAELMELKPAGYLLKPVKLDDVRNTIDNLCNT